MVYLNQSGFFFYSIFKLREMLTNALRALRAFVKKLKVERNFVFNLLKF